MSFMQIETFHGHFQIIRNTNEGDIICPEQYAEYSSNADAAKAYGVDESDVETVFGWAARYSAPGYLDCTDWIGVHKTEAKAIKECKEMYGDEEVD